MMRAVEEMPLARQVDYVFRQLENELTNAVGGTVSIQIRNNAVGKYGVKHHPIDTRDGVVNTCSGTGLSAEQVAAFRKMAVEVLQMKRNWTHGEIQYDFSVRESSRNWSASVMYESNYNAVNWMSRYQPQHKTSFMEFN
ncbi:O-methyltransferase [Paenibacillus sambharensis]